MSQEWQDGICECLRMLKHEAVTEKIIGIFYDVCNVSGHGFLESVYREAMLLAWKETGFQVDREKAIKVHFRGNKVGIFFADLMVENLVLGELKVARTSERIHEAQLLHDLKATDIEVGLLLNFGDRPQGRRMFLDEHKKATRSFSGVGSGEPSIEICPIRG